MLSLLLCCAQVSPQPIVTRGIDLCQSHIEPFVLTDGEVLKHDNLKNAVRVNALLATKCKETVPNAKEVKNLAP